MSIASQAFLDPSIQIAQLSCIQLLKLHVYTSVTDSTDKSGNVADSFCVAASHNQLLRIHNMHYTQMASIPLSRIAWPHTAHDRLYRPGDLVTLFKVGWRQNPGMPQHVLSLQLRR